MEKILQLLKNRKGQIGKKLNIVVGVIITIVVLFVLFSNLVPEVQTAGTEFSDATKCTEVSCNFNSSLDPACRTNATPAGLGGNSSVACLEKFQTVPLASLFSSTGIVVLLLMVFLLLTVIKIAMPSKK